MTQPRVALISAVPAAIPPATEALSERFPRAEVWNILDDRLLSDADAAGGLTPELRARMNQLIDHALMGGASSVLLTCSLYGEVARDYVSDVPVLAPDESAFDEIIAGRFESVLVVASFDSARDDSVARLRNALDSAGVSTAVLGQTIPAAMTATKSGDRSALVTALRDGLTNVNGVSAIFLAQYSLAPAAVELAAAVRRPVLAGPISAATALDTLTKSGATQ